MFLLDLQSLARKSGRTLGWIAGAGVISSARKLDEHGDWHYAKFPFRLMATFFSRGGPMRQYAERYWYGEQRSVHYTPTRDGERQTALRTRSDGLNFAARGKP